MRGMLENGGRGKKGELSEGRKISGRALKKRKKRGVVLFLRGVVNEGLQEEGCIFMKLDRKGGGLMKKKGGGGKTAGEKDH